MKLANYKNKDYSPGAAFPKQVLWHFIGRPLVESQLVPFSSFKIAVLRAFGARIGGGVRVKPGVRVKFPWRLEVGEDSWIGENVWIDNLAVVRIGSNVCVSQGAYLCTGSHDWKLPTFDLQTKPITIEDRAWVAAKAVVAPGVRIAEGAVLALASVATTDLEPWSIYRGNPAMHVGDREERTDAGL